MSVAEQSYFDLRDRQGLHDEIAISKIARSRRHLHAHFANTAGTVMDSINPRATGTTSSKPRSRRVSRTSRSPRPLVM